MDTNFKQCECGCDLFTIKQNVSGFSYFVVGSFGEEADNSGMYDHLSFKNSWKFFRCVDCGRRAKPVEVE